MANRRGFTLIELLIVVVIIGILAAIAIPKFGQTREKANQAAMKSDLRNLLSAQETFFSDSAKYTTDTSRLGGWRPSAGVTISASAAGAATLNFTLTKAGSTCTVFYGFAATTPASDGVPFCG